MLKLIFFFFFYLIYLFLEEVGERAYLTVDLDIQFENVPLVYTPLSEACIRSCITFTYFTSCFLLSMHRNMAQFLKHS